MLTHPLKCILHDLIKLKSCPHKLTQSALPIELHSLSSDELKVLWEKQKQLVFGLRTSNSQGKGWMGGARSRGTRETKWRMGNQRLGGDGLWKEMARPLSSSRTSLGSVRWGICGRCSRGMKEFPKLPFRVRETREVNNLVLHSLKIFETLTSLLWSLTKSLLIADHKLMVNPPKFSKNFGPPKSTDKGQ